MVVDVTQVAAPIARVNTYTQFRDSEGLPAVHGFAVEDLRILDLAPWGRKGGRGRYERYLRLRDPCRRRAQPTDEATKLVRQRGDEFARQPQRLPRILCTPEEQPEVGHRRDLMERELKAEQWR